MVSNIPSGMVTDQFGIAGLLTFIRAANENDHNLIALAPGIDLTTLGLNLNSPEYVHMKTSCIFLLIDKLIKI